MKLFLHSLVYAIRLVLSGWRITHTPDDSGYEAYRFWWAPAGIDQPKSVFDIDVVRYENGTVRNMVVCVEDDATQKANKRYSGHPELIQLVRHHTEHAPSAARIWGPLWKGNVGWELDFGAVAFIFLYKPDNGRRTRVIWDFSPIKRMMKHHPQVIK